MNRLVRSTVVWWLSCFWWMGCGQTAPRISLHQAVEQGNLQAVQQHIAAKTDLNTTDASGWTPLHLAAKKGDLTIFKALSDAGADVKRKGKGGKTPLDLARENGRTTIVQHIQRLNSKPARGLIDGGLGVSDALDSP